MLETDGVPLVGDRIPPSIRALKEVELVNTSVKVQFDLSFGCIEWVLNK